jgi:uncharacterized membrane protein
VYFVTLAHKGMNFLFPSDCKGIHRELIKQTIIITIIIIMIMIIIIIIIYNNNYNNNNNNNDDDDDDDDDDHNLKDKYIPSYK